MKEITPEAASAAGRINWASLNPMEEAKAIHRLMRDHRLDRIQTGHLLGKSPGTIDNRLCFLRLSSEDQDRVARGELLQADVFRLLNGQEPIPRKRPSRKKKTKLSTSEIVRKALAKRIGGAFEELPEAAQAKIIKEVVTLVGAISSVFAEELEKVREASPSEAAKPSSDAERPEGPPLGSPTPPEPDPSPDPPPPDDDEACSADGDGTSDNDKPELNVPKLTAQEAHVVLFEMFSIDEDGVGGTINFGKARLSKQLGSEMLNGHNVEEMAVGAIRAMRDVWGRQVPRGNSPERDLVVYVRDVKEAFRVPKFKHFLVRAKELDTSGDPVNLDFLNDDIPRP